MKTVKKWAEHDGIKIRTAQAARQRLGIGLAVGIGYLLTEKEWQTLKSSIRTGNQSEFARQNGLTRNQVSRMIKKGDLIKTEEGIFKK